MQQRVSRGGRRLNPVELNRLTNTQLWDLARQHTSDQAYQLEIRRQLCTRRNDIAIAAIEWIDAQGPGGTLPLPQPPRTPPRAAKRWGLLALLSAGALAMAGGIAHGAGVSIWHVLILPLFGSG